MGLFRWMDGQTASAMTLDESMKSAPLKRVASNNQRSATQVGLTTRASVSGSLVSKKYLSLSCMLHRRQMRPTSFVVKERQLSIIIIPTYESQARLGLATRDWLSRDNNQANHTRP